MLKIKIFCCIFLVGFFRLYGIEENNINQLGEKLKVNVKFSIPKNPIKYVVYASNDDGKTMSDTLQLPSFILSQDPNKAGFITSPPKVYTKRVVNGKLVDLEGTDKVTYTLTHPDGFMPKVLTDTMGPQGTTNNRLPINYLSKATLDRIVAILGNKYEVNDRGNIMIKGTNKRYAPAATIKMLSHNGILEIASSKYEEFNKIPSEDIQKVENFISGGVSMARVVLKVTLD